jgi:hypothetical protein
MSELTRLVDAAGASSLPYVDPAFPDQSLVLHAVRPRGYDTETPVLFVHHGVHRNGENHCSWLLQRFPSPSLLGDGVSAGEAHALPKRKELDIGRS